MNAPNSVTVARIMLIPVFMVLLLGNVPYGRWWAVLAFSIAAITDSLDGYLARRHRQVTVMGQFLDPLADKLLVSAALISLVDLNSLSAWIATLIISREFAVSGLRLMAAARGIVVPAYPLGKAKTVAQVVAIITWIVSGTNLPGWADSIGYAAYFLMGIALALTLVSGIDYFRRLWPLLAEGGLDES